MSENLPAIKSELEDLDYIDLLKNEIAYMTKRYYARMAANETSMAHQIKLVIEMYTKELERTIYELNQNICQVPLSSNGRDKRLFVVQE